MLNDDKDDDTNNDDDDMDYPPSTILIIIQRTTHTAHSRRRLYRRRLVVDRDRERDSLKSFQLDNVQKNIYLFLDIRVSDKMSYDDDMITLSYHWSCQMSAVTYMI